MFFFLCLGDVSFIFGQLWHRVQLAHLHGIGISFSATWHRFCGWGSMGLRSKTSGPCVARGKAVFSTLGRVHSWWLLGSAPVLLMILMHSRGAQSVQFVTSALHRCPLMMVCSCWICQAVSISVHWNSLQNMKQVGWQSAPSRPSTQYLTYKWWIVSIGW